MPHMPTLPLHHGCAASHSTASYPSSVSASVYSSSATPGEEPVPRTSSRHSANPRAASHSPRAVSPFRRQLSLPYGIISRMTGKRSSGALGQRPRQPQVRRQLQPVADGDPDVPPDLDVVDAAGSRRVGRRPRGRGSRTRGYAAQGLPSAPVKNATSRGSYSVRVLDRRRACGPCPGRSSTRAGRRRGHGRIAELLGVARREESVVGAVDDRERPARVVRRSRRAGSSRSGRHRRRAAP